MKKSSVLLWPILGLMAACHPTPEVSDAEEGFLDRTQGMVEPGSYPIAQELPGTDGYLLKFHAGDGWDTKDGREILVNGYNGQPMPFYAAQDSMGQLQYVEAGKAFEIFSSKGEWEEIYIIASPEKDIAQIAVNHPNGPISLFQRGDSIAPAKSDRLRVKPQEEVKGRVVDDTTSKGANGSLFHTK
jgi:hypothetical protein